MIPTVAPSGGAREERSSIMFGFGNRRRVRNDTFAPSRIRGAALAGLGMLAWRWWRNRQASGQSTTKVNRPYTDTTTRPAGTY
jgi:hypothetical protein